MSGLLRRIRQEPEVWRVLPDSRHVLMTSGRRFGEPHLARDYNPSKDPAGLPAVGYAAQFTADVPEDRDIRCVYFRLTLRTTVISCGRGSRTDPSDCQGLGCSTERRGWL